ncbi:MAG: class C sortase [Ruminococcus sp.]|jgi:sortase A
MSQNTNRTKQKKKNPLVLLAPLLIFAVGAGIFLYPAVSNFLAERNQSNVIHTYQAKVNELDQEEIDEAWAEAIEYNENLAGDPVHDPFVMGSGYVLPDNYEEVLNLNGDGVMGYVEIPKIDVYLPIYHGTSEEVLAEGAGHLDVTALPIGGEGNHSVISAHRGLPSAELFTRLDEMEEGDTFYIHVLDQTLAYEVDQIEVILPEELTLLQPEEGKDLVTLLTCTPYAVNTHRLLVRGTRVPYEEAEARDSEQILDSDSGWRTEYMIAVAAGIGVLVLLIVVICIVWKIRRKSRRE